MERIISEFQQKSIAPSITLSESSLLRYIAFTALYAAQGLPGGLLGVALPAWLVENGWGADQIALYLAIVFFPWSFKPIAGPLMDRFTFLPMGRRRPWVLAAQLGLLLSFAVMAAIPDPVDHFCLLVSLGFIVSLCASFQDVAVDGMAIELLPEDQQARANGFMWGGKTVGRALATAGGAFLLNTLGYSFSVLLIAGFLGLIFLIPLLFRERPCEKLLPWTSGKISEISLKLQPENWKSIFINLIRAFWLPTSRLAITGFFILFIGDGVLEVILPVLTVGQLGWDDVTYSSLSATSKLIAGFSGMLIGASLVDRIGKIRSLFIIVIPMVLFTLAMGLFPDLWQNKKIIISYIFCRDICIVTVTITFLAISMGLSWQKIAATQFALYMALSNLSDTAGSSTVKLLNRFFEFQHFFIMVAICYGTLLIFMWFVNMEKHQEDLKLLDANNISPGDSNTDNTQKT